MRSAEQVTRAQARALIRVFREYGLERRGETDVTAIWQAIEAYGNGEPGALDLKQISIKFRAAHGAASGFMGIPRQPGKYGLLQALYAFCCIPLVNRFHQASWAVVAALPNRDPSSDPRPIHAEIFEKLEDAFDEEMFPKVAA